MGTVYNIRGTNGSGKSTLVRGMIPDEVIRGTSGPEAVRWGYNGGPVDLVWYLAPTKKDPDRHLRTEGYAWHEVLKAQDARAVGVVGHYRTATGGMDNIGTFSVQQESITDLLERPLFKCDVVLAEGVLASTVYGSWADFDRQLERDGHRFAYVYMGTPLDECLRRITQRQEASGKVREIKRELVEDKMRAIVATRKRAMADGRLVYDLPFMGEHEAMRAIIAGRGEGFRARQ